MNWDGVELVPTLPETMCGGITVDAPSRCRTIGHVPSLGQAATEPRDRRLIDCNHLTLWEVVMWHITIT
ncbi:MAG: hypothetical protein QF927_03275 [Verrucomicrobiota bacterium]|nr:hypothetical protein [Verrucomicrobiota bacterium]